MDFVGNVMSLLFNVLSRLVITFLLRSKCLNFMATITICSDFGAQKNKVSHCFQFLHLFPMKWWDQMTWSSFSVCWALSQLFHSPLSLSSRGSLITILSAPQLYTSPIPHSILSTTFCSPRLFLSLILRPLNETGAYYTEWSKPERKTPIQYTNAYIWNLERW